jgi:3-oxoacyl-[acyl-carrier-protein] synthase-3
MKVFIKAISYYLPERILTNQELTQRFPEWTVEKVASKIGIDQRHIAAEDEFVSDMAVKAAKKLFLEHQITPQDIDFILLCTQSPDYFLPTTACLVQDRLNIPTSAGALDFNLGCSGYIYGLALAKGLLAGGIAKNVLLLTSEVYSKHIHEADKGNATIFGDAASATLIASSGFAEIQQFDLGTDGAGGKNLIVKQGALKHPNRSFEEVVLDDGSVQRPAHLYMNGSEIFNFTIDRIPGLVARTLELNNLQKEDIRLFVFHQANKFMLNHLRMKMGIDSERFYVHMKNCGNTVSATIPIALIEAINEGITKENDEVLLAGFGVGYSWGACTIKF